MGETDIARRVIDAVAGEEDILITLAALAYVASMACVISAEETGGAAPAVANKHALLVREGVRMLTDTSVAGRPA